MNIIRKLINIIELIVFVALLALLFLVASPLLPTKSWFVVYVVASGSMEPTIPTGSVVISRPTDPSILTVDDVIAFASPDEPKKIIIHRIIGIQNDGTTKSFITKGDNNNTQDSWTITPALIKGKQILSIPYIGYGINYLKTPPGFAVGIGIPALLLVLLELKKIKEGIDEEIKRRTTQEIIHAKNTGLLLLLIVSISFSLCTKPVQAFFSATVTAHGITLSVADFDSIHSGNVIINEIMRQGSTANTADNWIELKNMTNNPVNLSACALTGVLASNNNGLIFSSGMIIQPDGYFLIAKKESGNTALSESVLVNLSVNSLKFDKDYDKNGRITLTCHNEVIDETPEPVGPNWPSGDKHRSMIRNGAVWETCEVDTCHDDRYWQQDGNFGTPGGVNPINADPTLSIASDKHTAKIILDGTGITTFKEAYYQLRYQTNGVEKEIKGIVAIDTQPPISTNPIILGTCSDYGTCVYDETIKWISVKVMLKGTTEHILFQELAF